MASIGGVNLHVEDPSHAAGAAFQLTMPAHDSQTITMGDGARCHLTEGHPYFVVTLLEVTVSTISELLPFAYETAQRGLDLMAVQGLGDYALTRADDGTVT